MKLNQLILIVLFSLVVVLPSFINADEPEHQFTFNVKNRSGLQISARVNYYGNSDKKPDTDWIHLQNGDDYLFTRFYEERGYILGIWSGLYIDSVMVHGKKAWQSGVEVHRDYIYFYGQNISYRYKYTRDKPYKHNFQNSNHNPYCMGGESF